MGVGGQRYVPATLPPRTRLYPLHRRLGGLQGRSEKARKNSPPTGIRSPDRPARSESIVIGSKWNKDVTLCDWVLPGALKDGSDLKTPWVTQDTASLFEPPESLAESLREPEISPVQWMPLYKIKLLKINVCIGMIEKIPSFGVNLCGLVIISFVARLLPLCLSLILLKQMCNHAVIQGSFCHRRKRCWNVSNIDCIKTVCS